MKNIKYEFHVTCLEKKENGTAVILFEDYKIGYQDKEALSEDDELNYRLLKKIETVEAINDELTSPF